MLKMVVFYRMKCKKKKKKKKKKTENVFPKAPDSSTEQTG